MSDSKGYDFAIILRRAVDFDKEKRYQEALLSYEHGLELMLKAIKGFKERLGLLNI